MAQRRNAASHRDRGTDSRAVRLELHRAHRIVRSNCRRQINRAARDRRRRNRERRRGLDIDRSRSNADCRERTRARVQVRISLCIARAAPGRRPLCATKETGASQLSIEILVVAVVGGSTSRSNCRLNYARCACDHSHVYRGQPEPTVAVAVCAAVQVLLGFGSADTALAVGAVGSTIPNHLITT